MASEEKGPIDLFRRIRSGVKAARTAYKVGTAAEKANQIKIAKRAAAAAKASETRAANKAAKVKAAEEAAAKAKRGRKPKAAVEPVKPVTPNAKAKRVSKKELAAKAAKRQKIATGIYTGAGIGLVGGMGYGAYKAKSKSLDKQQSSPQLEKKIKAYDDSVKRAREKSFEKRTKPSYKFAKGGTKKR